jgi:hypothetical protein
MQSSVDSGTRLTLGLAALAVLSALGAEEGLSYTTRDALVRHRGQASAVRVRFERLAPGQQRELLAFLDSL